MPEYLAPGVYIEEVSYRSKSIEGVSTTTTGFIGPTRYGPIDLEPDIVTGLGEFERIYGDNQQLNFGNAGDDSTVKIHNFMWHAVRGFFEEGGKRLYISRTFRPITDENNVVLDDGYAKAYVPASDTEPIGDWLKISARFPGDLGKMRVWLTLRLGQSILGKREETVKTTKDGNVEEESVEFPTTGSLLNKDVVLITENDGSPNVSISTFYIADNEDRDKNGDSIWKFVPLNPTGSPSERHLSDLDVDKGDKIQVVTLTVITRAVGNPEALTLVYEGLALDPNHKRGDTPDSFFAKFDKHPASASEARRLPIVIDAKEDSFANGLDILKLFFDEKSDLEARLKDSESTELDRTIPMILDGGNDGMRPSAKEYEGDIDINDAKSGLKAFEDIEDISIVAAPGSTFGYEDTTYKKVASTITNLLISHAERMKYRIAVLDSGNDQAIVDVRAMRARLDSKYAAFYYPWVRILDPVTQQEIHLPPSGFVSGIYARNDIERAVYKAPANEVVRLSIGFEKTLNKAQQEVLNPEGINCFRFFEGRGFRLWGARTTSSDPEWKYVNLRRYFAYLERSIDIGTQWAVFEPNGEALWANVRQTIQDFLYNEWVSGALLGEKPDKAYFVKCDRSTMTQNDLDNGRLICKIGLAVVKPAEFVIFRIGQWTSDRKV
jgi:uncharacterized protein